MPCTCLSYSITGRRAPTPERYELAQPHNAATIGNCRENRFIANGNRWIDPRGEPSLYRGECAALLLNPADIVVIDATTPEEAIAEIRQPGAVDKRGRRMVSQHPPELVRSR